MYWTKSPVTVLRELRKQYPVENIKKYHVYRAVKRFEETGSVTDGRHRNSSRPKSGVQKTLLKWDKVIEETPQMSIRKVLGNISNQASRTSVHRIWFKTYTVQNICDATSQRQGIWKQAAFRASDERKWSNGRCHLVLRRGAFPFECTGRQKKLSVFGKREARFVPGKTFTWRIGYSVGGNEFCWDHRAFLFLKMNREMLRL